MEMYRKKPVVIEAKKLEMHTAMTIKWWLASHGVIASDWSKPPMRALSGLIIPTLEGPHKASWGDWIIKGIQGEFYPCKPDIFEATYEKVEPNESNSND